MLKNRFKLAKNIISKNPIVFKLFLEKVFIFFLCHWILGLEATLLLILLLNHQFAKKQVGKKDFIWPISSNNFIIIFILLAKTIAI